jgi:putative MATE family efflux protein
MKESVKQEIEFSNRDLRLLIVPFVIEQLLAIAVGLCDSIMVSYVGEAAISAVSLVDTVNVLLINAFSALATGGAVIVGQYLGRKEPQKAGHSGAQLLLFMAEISLVIMAVFYLAKGFVLGVVFGEVEPDVAAFADTYYVIVQASIPFLALYSAGAAIFRVMGNSRISMYVSALMNLINLVGNAVLIFGFHMGVEGVAIPTLVSRAVAAVVILILLYRPGLSLQIERVTWKHDPYVVKNILRFGVPNGMESSMFQLGKILLLSTVSVLGTAAVAANAVGNMVATFQCIPGLAIGFAMVTVVSRCVGAGDYEKARFYTKKLMKYTYVMMGIAILISLVGLPWILQLYKVSEEAEACASQLVWLHGVLGAIFWPLSFTLPQALRAAGDTRYTMVSGTISMWTLRVGLGILMGRYWGLGVLGVWIAMCIDWLLRVTLFVVLFKGHKWETMGIKD